MLHASQFFVWVALILVILTVGCFIAVLMMARALPATGDSDGSALDQSSSGTHSARRWGLASYGDAFCWLALAALTTALVLRAIVTGHGPFSSQYEFSLAFGWGTLALYAYFAWRYRVRTLGLVVLPVTAAMLLYASTLGAENEPLVPALQNNLLLTVHVATAIIAYGAFSVASAAALLFLIQPNGRRAILPRPALLEEIGYRAVLIAFPFMTLTVILGAVWADVAWGKYWSWDPKETASLLTWLVYGAYLHARAVRGWRGSRAAWLLMLGFIAVLFTFLGNLFFGGLHSYGAS